MLLTERPAQDADTAQLFGRDPARPATRGARRPAGSWLQRLRPPRLAITVIAVSAIVTTVGGLASGSSYERFLAGQRKGVKDIFVMVVGLVAFMWVATLVDWAFNCGWGWDRQNLWLGPSMVLFAVLVRFCAMAIFKLVGSSL